MIYLPVSGSGWGPRRPFGMEATKAVFVPEPSGFGVRSCLARCAEASRLPPHPLLSRARPERSARYSLHAGPGDFLRLRRVKQAALCNRQLWAFEGEYGRI